MARSTRRFLDVSDWVERGIAPPASTVYTVEDGQVETPDHAKERLGVQPTVQLLANGGKRAQVKPGETVRLSAAAALPPGTGRLVSARWNFEGEAGFPVEGQFENMSEDGCEATINAEHTYAKPGTYFAVCRVQASRDGTSDDIFTQIFELDRVRIVCRAGMSQAYKGQDIISDNLPNLRVVTAFSLCC